MTDATEGFRLVGGKWEIDKAVDSTVDYTFDWTDWLNGDTIATKAPEVKVGNVTIASSQIADKLDDQDLVVAQSALVVVWLSGGTVGTKCEVTCKITTAGGRTDERSAYIKVVESKWR